VGFDCKGVIRAESEDAAVAAAVAVAAAHAQNVHGLTEIGDEVVAKVRTAQRDK
jgi:predicted small metal-binding protein